MVISGLIKLYRKLVYSTFGIYNLDYMLKSIFSQLTPTASFLLNLIKNLNLSAKTEE